MGQAKLKGSFEERKNQAIAQFHKFMQQQHGPEVKSGTAAHPK